MGYSFEIVMRCFVLSQDTSDLLWETFAALQFFCSLLHHIIVTENKANRFVQLKSKDLPIFPKLFPPWA